MRSDFMLAINQLCAERKLSPEVVMEVVEASLISAYKRNFGGAANIEVQIEPSTGDVRVYAAKEVVDAVADPKTQISLEEAQQESPEIGTGDTVLIETTPRDFGRIAAQTAKQVILQRIREAERDAQYSAFADSAGEIAHGTIQSIDHMGDAVVSIEGAEAILPVREQVSSERYRRGTRLRAYVLDVRRGNRGPQITLSRRSPDLLRRLLELEVPEIFNGSVEIKAIAREAGSRSKVAVYATQDGVDPVGSCVGVRGGRIQNIVNELAGEKIDVVQWDPEMGAFIGNALSPAKVMNVLLDENPDTGKTATVIVPDRQLSLAIGKEGQNARLAAKLTGWRIDIKSASEAAAETLGPLEDLEIAPEDMDLLRLAESLLRQGLENVSEEDKDRVKAEVETGHEEDLVWPDEEPVPEVEADAEAGIAEEIGPEEVAAEPVTVVSKEEDAGEGLGIVAPETERQDAVEEDVAEQPEGLIEETEEEVPPEMELPFEGELVEESIGWVQVELEEDYYSGWSELEEAEEPDLEWVREEIEPEGQEPPRRGKKRKKKRGRQTYDYGSDSEERGDRPGQTPSRSRRG
jgi:N utilization substance protein A